MAPRAPPPKPPFGAKGGALWVKVVSSPAQDSRYDVFPLLSLEHFQKAKAYVWGHVTIDLESWTQARDSMHTSL